MFIVIFRTLFMYMLVVLTMRVMGKRQLGQLEPGELVATIMISELASMPIAETDMPLLYPVSAIAIIFALEVLTALLALKSIKLRKIFNGKPSMLIERGKINRGELRKNRLTVDELVEELRQKDVTDLNQVNYAILEQSGMLSVIQKPSTLPVILISDGRMITSNMEYMGVTERYIADELKSRGIRTFEEVFLLMLDEQHVFYIYTQQDVA